MSSTSSTKISTYIYIYQKYRGEHSPSLRLVTAFGRTKIGAQILIDELKI